MRQANAKNKAKRFSRKASCRTCPEAPAGRRNHKYVTRTIDASVRDRKYRKVGYLVESKVCEYCGDMRVVKVTDLGARARKSGAQWL